jgi:methyltransferase family protein
VPVANYSIYHNPRETEVSQFEAYWAKSRQRPSTCLGDVAELETRRLSSFDAAMPADLFARKLPRKWWEWEYIAECAEALGVLTLQSTALGLGAGFEPLIFHFANYCKRVIATDLYSGDTAWSEARFETTQQVLESSPIPYNRNRVEVRNADMRHTGADPGSIDFIWSCSSIEHILTLKDLFLVFAEIDRILKVGGHAVLTTEFSITANPYLLPGVNAWNQEILQAVKGALNGFEFLGPTDLAFNSLHPGNAARPRRYMPVSSLLASSPALSYYHRCGTLANPVGLSIIVPIAFVIRKTSQAGVAGWDAVDIAPRLRTYSDGVAALFDGKADVAIEKLGEVYRSCDDDLQMKHLAFRFLIDAKARSGHMEKREAFADAIEEFLTHLPSGPVQDADALDICGYLLGKCGRTKKGLDVYERCIRSPSTSREHLFELLGRYLELGGKSGAKARSTALAASIIADLVQFGLSSSELHKLCLTPLSNKMGATLTEEVMARTRQHLALAMQALAV